MSNENNAAAVAPRMGANIAIGRDGALQFGTVADVIDYGKLCVMSGMSPKGMNAEQCAMAIISGQSLGLNPFASMQGIAVINGRPSLWGDTLVALVMASGLCEDIQTEYLPNRKDCKGVQVTVRRKGVATPVVGTFSENDAKLAGLWGKAGPWTQYPVRMMMNRARAFALRDAFPDLLKGMGIAEEVRDAVDVTADADVSGAPYDGADGSGNGGTRRNTPKTLRDALRIETKKDAPEADGRAVGAEMTA